MMKALSMKSFPHRALYEGDDVRVVLQAPGVNVEELRKYYERQGLLGTVRSMSWKQLDYLPWDQYLAWCSYLTKDEPPSRDHAAGR